MSNVNCVSLCNTNTQQQRHRTTPAQVQYLEDYFTNTDDFPDSNEREKISIRLKMPSKSVHIWFQNRRAKRKNEEKTRQEQEVIRFSRVNPTPSTTSSISSVSRNHVQYNKSTSSARQAITPNRQLSRQPQQLGPRQNSTQDAVIHQRSLYSLSGVACKPHPLVEASSHSQSAQGGRLPPLRNVTSDDKIRPDIRIGEVIALPPLSVILSNRFQNCTCGVNSNLHVSQPFSHNLGSVSQNPSRYPLHLNPLYPVNASSSLMCSHMHQFHHRRSFHCQPSTCLSVSCMTSHSNTAMNVLEEMRKEAKKDKAV
ncbi:12560_t:CDS:2, partial [Acaulospora morrowiae]